MPATKFRSKSSVACAYSTGLWSMPQKRQFCVADRVFFLFCSSLFTFAMLWMALWCWCVGGDVSVGIYLHFNQLSRWVVTYLFYFLCVRYICCWLLVHGPPPPSPTHSRRRAPTAQANRSNFMGKRLVSCPYILSNEHRLKALVFCLSERKSMSFVCSCPTMKQPNCIGLAWG